MSDGGSRGPAPGRLILVVGPSGAGKDSLIRHARERLADHPGFVFPRRCVTRPPSDAEDNLELDEAAFDRVSAGGGFAASWAAHGLRYGIPAAIAAELRAGRHVVCNVSRTVVGGLRERFAAVLVIEVTAPPDVLAARLAGRGRAADGDPAERLARTARLAALEAPDVTVGNDGALEDACRAFLEALGIAAKPGTPPPPA